MSDCGPKLTSSIWKEFCTVSAPQVSLSSGFHPQTNSELGDFLRCVVSSNPSTWSSQLAWVEYAYYSLMSSATGLSLFKASPGYQPPLFSTLESACSVPSVEHHLCRCQWLWRATQAALHQTKELNKQCVVTGLLTRSNSMAWWGDAADSGGSEPT